MANSDLVVEIGEDDALSGPVSLMTIEKKAADARDVLNLTNSDEDVLLLSESETPKPIEGKAQRKRLSGSERRRRAIRKAAAAATDKNDETHIIDITWGKDARKDIAKVYTPKRVRSNEDSLISKTPTSKTPQAKKAKGLTMAEVIQKTEAWRSLGREDGQELTEAELNKFREALNNFLLEEIMANPPKEVPIFDGIKLSDGRILTKCVNEFTKAWFLDKLPELAACTGHVLIASDPAPKMMPIPRFRVFFTLYTNGLNIETSKCFDVLARQNNGLVTAAWRQWQRQDVEGAIKLTCGIEQASVDYIKGRDNMLHFLSGTVRIFFDGKAKKTKNKPPNKQQSSAEVGALNRMQNNLFRRKPKGSNKNEKPQHVNNAVDKPATSTSTPAAEKMQVDGGDNGRQGNRDDGHLAS